MFKLAGSILLVAGFTGLSLEKIREDAKEIQRLNSINDFFLYLFHEIEYSHIPIPDICMEYQKRSEGELQIFLKRVCGQVLENPGKSFDLIWFEETEKGKMMGAYKEEKNILQNLGKCFGLCNVKMQQTAIQQKMRELETVIVQKEKKFRDNKKLTLYFGVMSGFLLSIILL